MRKLFKSPPTREQLEETADRLDAKEKTLGEKEEGLTKKEGALAEAEKHVKLREDVLKVKESDLDLKERGLRGLEEELAKRKSALDEQQNAIETRDKTLADAEIVNRREIQERAAGIASLKRREEEIVAGEKGLTTKSVTLAEKDTALARKDTAQAEKDVELSNRENKASRHEQALAAQEELINNKRRELAEKVALAKHISEEQAIGFGTLSRDLAVLERTEAAPVTAPLPTVETVAALETVPASKVAKIAEEVVKSTTAN